MREYKVLAVDCEGVNLGRNGELCLVQVGLGEERVFLFDVLLVRVHRVFREMCSLNYDDREARRSSRKGD